MRVAIILCHWVLAEAVGYDTRFMSGKFAEEAAIVLKNNGLEVTLSDRPTPTPALSFIVKLRKLDLGVMITASHNPAEYNGFKIKNAAGGGASQEITQAVEGLLGKHRCKVIVIKNNTRVLRYYLVQHYAKAALRNIFCVEHLNNVNRIIGFALN